MKEKWYHCILYGQEPYVAFGIAAKDGVVTQAAPSHSWMIGQQLNNLRNYFIKQKAVVTEVK